MVSVDVKHHVCFALRRGFTEFRRDQEEGGELDSHERVGLSFAGPGEMKRKEVNWTLKRAPDTDQEQGGGAGL